MAEAGPSREDIRVECERTGPVTRSLNVEVSAARVKRAFDRAYEDLRRHARVKGFRPGKVPRSVLQKMYGASLPDEIERTLVTESLPDAIELAEVAPVVEPDIEAGEPREGQAFRYTARVEVKPEIVLPDLDGLPARRPAVAVSEEDVETQLERLRERNAPLVEEPEGTEAAEGHVLTLDFVGRIDGEPFEGGSAQGMDVELGAGRLIPGFEAQLQGVQAGQDREVRVTFPPDYGQAALRGREAVFACHVVAVKKRQLPALDDEFAKDLGEFSTLDELRARIRADLLEQRESMARDRLRDSLVDALIVRCEFEVPPGVVERELQRQVESTARQFHGRVPDDVLRGQLARMQEEGRPRAERRVREALILEAVARQQQLVATADEVEARLRELAQAQGVEPEQLRRLAEQQGWRAGIEAELVDRKVVDFLTSRAKIEEIPEEISQPDASS